MRDFTITTGRIYDAIMQVNKLKNKLVEDVQAVNGYRDFSKEGKEKRIAEIKQEYNKKYSDLKSDMLEAVGDLKTIVASTPYEYSAELEHSIDYIRTMADAGILTDRMFIQEMDKYRGREMDYVFAREKLKGSVSTEKFDRYTFSTYKRDLNGELVFVSPLDRFNQLEKSIDSGNDLMMAHLLEQTENKLGIESVGRQKYNAEIQEKIHKYEENIPAII